MFVLAFFFAFADSDSASAQGWPPLPEALDALVSDAEVTITISSVPEWATPDDFYYVFSPAAQTPDEGLILYPGVVDERSYAPTARAIAEAGYLVALVPMPSDIALLGTARADTIIGDHPEIETWAIGGHSLGGVAASAYIANNDNLFAHSSAIDGLVLWASYPSEGYRVDGIVDLEAVSIYGTLDGLTTLDEIETSKDHLPSDTWFVPIEGANHTQFGWYDTSPYPVQPGIDHDGIPPDDPPDNFATISREEQQDLIVRHTDNFLVSLTPNMPAAVETITADDGSTWERVNIPGFDSDNNFSVVAMAEYQNRLYAMTRNQAEGAEVWRTNATGWEQVMFPGDETNGIYGNPAINNVWGKMIVFDGKLYFGFSSGLQGNYLGSTGCEIWRFDGVSWEPVVSDRADIDEQGTITAIADCADADGDTTAQITDSTKTWSADQWAGGTLQITSGSGQHRKFYIVGNTADTLIIQQNETAGTGADQASETEFTVCASKIYNNPYPSYSYTLGAVVAGDAYEIGMGADESGFGEVWNKTITDMLLFDGKLYVSTGLNYEYGAQVWYTDDGDAWSVTLPANSFGNYHPEATPYPDGMKPVSSSITNLAKFNGSLYAGGTGTSGGSGSCSRMALLTPGGWELIVDAEVDADDTGTNENGFGDGMGCDMNTGNFMPWSLALFNGMLHAGINSLGGARVLYSETASADDEDAYGDPTWKYSVGGDSVLPVGFDGSTDTSGENYLNIAVNLFPFGGTLFGGIVTMYVPEYGLSEHYGAPLWNSQDGLTWSPVTENGFGDVEIIMFEAFTEFGSIVHVAGSKGASSTPSGLGGAKIFRRVADPTLINLTSFTAKGFPNRVILKWETAGEIDNAGFNIYRSSAENGSYEQINAALIPARGSATAGSTYRFADTGVERGSIYYYRLEDIDTNGITTVHGPVSAQAGILPLLFNK